MLTLIKIEKHTEKLKLRLGTDLTQIDRIQIALLHQLLKLQIKNPDVDTLSKNLMDKGIIPHTHPNPDIQKELTDVHQKYATYCADLKTAYTDILNSYCGVKNTQVGYIEDTGRFGKLRYAIKGHFYQGKYQSFFLDTPYDNFLKLVNRLTLINSSYAVALQSKMTTLTGEFNYEAQRAFIDETYHIFSNVKANYDFAVEQRNIRYKNDLKKYYYLDLKSINEKEINDLYDAIVNNLDNGAKKAYLARQEQAEKDYEKIEEADQTELALANTQAQKELILKKIQTKNEKMLAQTQAWYKLHYDLQKIHQEKEANDKLAHHQLKELKKDIHHLAQQLGLYSRIAKDNQDQYYVATEQEAKSLVHEKKQRDRQIKHQNKWLAFFSAIFVGLGEGLVPVAGVVAAFPIIPFWVALLVAGTTGWFCNYFLFKDDTNSMLKEFRLKKNITEQEKDGTPKKTKSVRGLFLNEKNEEISRVKKGLILFFGALSLATGFVYGALSFFSVHDAVLNILPSLSNVGANVLAAAPAIATAIGMTCIFFTVISDFIKNERWNGIASYFRNTYSAPWKAMNTAEKLQHIFLRCPFEILKLTFGIAVNIIITVATFGMFYKNALDLLGKVVNINAKGVSTAAYITSAANSAASTPFNVGKTVETVASLLHQKTFAPLSSEKPPVLNAAQQDVKSVSTVGNVVAYVATGINAAAYGSLLATQAKDSLGFNAPLQAAAGVSQATGSALPNMESIIKSKEKENTIALTTAVSNSSSLPTVSVATTPDKNSAEPSVAINDDFCKLRFFDPNNTQKLKKISSKTTDLSQEMSQTAKSRVSVTFLL
jgi:hypothetical protein